MFEVICSKCNVVIKYNIELAHPEKPSHGLCDRCLFIYKQTLGIGRIRRFRARRKAAKIFDLAHPDYHKDLIESNKWWKDILEISEDIDSKPGPKIFSF